MVDKVEHEMTISDKVLASLRVEVAKIFAIATDKAVTKESRDTLFRILVLEWFFNDDFPDIDKNTTGNEMGEKVLAFGLEEIKKGRFHVKHKKKTRIKRGLDCRYVETVQLRRVRISAPKRKVKLCPEENGS